MADWLYEKVDPEEIINLTMGDLEKILDKETLEIRRQALERLTQDRANCEEFGCPDCGNMLKVVHHHRERVIDSVFGKIRFTRSYGECSRCNKYVYPADTAMGLHAHARTSPRIQEICATVLLLFTNTLFTQQLAGRLGRGSTLLQPYLCPLFVYGDLSR